MNEAKPWYTSKTIWTNGLALMGAIALALGFDADRWAEVSTVALAVLNLALRMVTTEPISAGASSQRLE